MFNLNGKKMLSSSYSLTGTTSFVLSAIKSSNQLYDTSGNAFGSDNEPTYLYYNTSGLTTDNLIQAVSKFMLTGYTGQARAGIDLTSQVNVDRYLFYNVGYRGSEFSETTYTVVNQATSYTSRTQSLGVPTYTVSNTTDSPLTIDEINFSCAVRYSNQYRAVLFAGFYLGEITIPAHSTYSFTITANS